MSTRCIAFKQRYSTLHSALSRLKHGFESRRECQPFQCLRSRNRLPRIFGQERVLRLPKPAPHHRRQCVGTPRARCSYTPSHGQAGRQPERYEMLALKSLLAACTFALLVHPAVAANDAEGRGAADGMQERSPPAGAPTPTVRPRGDSGIGTNTATCARPKLTPEQRAERKALREQRMAQGMQPPPRTAEQKARAAARRAARCGS
jgi:hypothetical protein